MTKKLLSALAIGLFSFAAIGADLPSFFKTDSAELQADMDASKPVLIVFSASWCGPCKALVRDVWNDKTEFAPSFEDYDYTPYYMDIDASENAEIRSQFQFNTIPTIYLIKNGKDLFTQVPET